MRLTPYCIFEGMRVSLCILFRVDYTPPIRTQVKLTEDNVRAKSRVHGSSSECWSLSRSAAWDSEVSTVNPTHRQVLVRAQQNMDSC